MEELVGRVFVAVVPPREVRYVLGEILSGMPIPGRKVPAANWHITLRFLDAIDRVTYERYLAALGRPTETAFRIRLDEFGAFPNARKATVFWAGLGDGATQLAMLNEQAEEAALAAGLTPEERPFHPHLTLSRIRPPADVRELLDEELDLSWRCERLVILKSHLGRGGATYEPLDSVDLIG